MAETSADASWPAFAAPSHQAPRRGRPRVVVRADLLPGFGALSLIALLGIPLGWVWSLLAPAERVRVLRGDEVAPLAMETWNRFADVGIFLLLGLAGGVVVGAAVWLVRGRRGPVMMIAAVAGSALSAVFAMRMGVSFANGRHAVGAAPEVGQVVERAPELGTAWVLLAQPLATALVYGVLAVWNGHDDLGRRLT